jgi:hypothetical protein
MRVLSARIPLLLANALRATEEDVASAEPEQRCGTVWPPLARKHGRAYDYQTTASRTVLLHVLPRSVVRKIWAREFNSSYGKTHTISDDSLPSPWSEFWDWRRLQKWWYGIFSGSDWLRECANHLDRPEDSWSGRRDLNPRPLVLGKPLDASSLLSVSFVDVWNARRTSARG